MQTQSIANMDRDTKAARTGRLHELYKMMAVAKELCHQTIAFAPTTPIARAGSRIENGGVNLG